MSANKPPTIVPIYGIFEPFNIIKRIINRDELKLELREKDITLNEVDLSSNYNQEDINVLRTQLGLIDVRIQRVAGDVKEIRVASPLPYRSEVDKIFKEGYTDEVVKRNGILFIF